MSRLDVLRECVNDRRLFEVVPILPGPQGRIVYATPEVFRQLDPSTADLEIAAGAGELRSWLDAFTKERWITVGNRRSRHADMKILEPENDEVWEIRKRETPSTRIFGRFADKNIFVATNIRTVKDLFSLEWKINGLVTWPIWRAEIRRCKAIWRTLFLTYPPHTGNSLDDYLSLATEERTR